MSSSTWRVLRGYATYQRTPVRIISGGKWAPLKSIMVSPPCPRPESSQREIIPQITSDENLRQNPTASLFVTRRGGPLSRTVITQTFHQVLMAAGIPRAPQPRRPRLIDLRHTFAVRALEASPETREAIGRHTLALTTYMGHTCVASTYWYLESTPQLMADIAQSCAAFLYGGHA